MVAEGVWTDNYVIGFPNSLKFFPKLSCVWTLLPYSPDYCTLATRNFYIKAWSILTIIAIVWTVDLMHVISIYEA
jgi:hypothetical protein